MTILWHTPARTKIWRAWTGEWWVHPADRSYTENSDGPFQWWSEALEHAQTIAGQP